MPLRSAAIIVKGFIVEPACILPSTAELKYPYLPSPNRSPPYIARTAPSPGSIEARPMCRSEVRLPVGRCSLTDFAAAFCASLSIVVTILYPPRSICASERSSRSRSSPRTSSVMKPMSLALASERFGGSASGNSCSARSEAVIQPFSTMPSRT